MVTAPSVTTSARRGTRGSPRANRRCKADKRAREHERSRRNEEEPAQVEDDQRAGGRRSAEHGTENTRDRDRAEEPAPLTGVEQRRGRGPELRDEEGAAHGAERVETGQDQPRRRKEEESRGARCARELRDHQCAPYSEPRADVRAYRTHREGQSRGDHVHVPERSRPDVHEEHRVAHRLEGGVRDNDEKEAPEAGQQGPRLGGSNIEEPEESRHRGRRLPPATGDLPLLAID